MASPLFLSGRPLHGAAAEQVDVEVGDCLPSVVAGIDDQAVARCDEALLCCDLAGFEQQVAEQGAVLGRGVLHTSDDFLGYDEDVRRGLGLDVAGKPDSRSPHRRCRREFRGG